MCSARCSLYGASTTSEFYSTFIFKILPGKKRNQSGILGIGPTLICHLHLSSPVIFSLILSVGPGGKISQHVQLLGSAAFFCGWPKGLPPNLVIKPLSGLHSIFLSPRAEWCTQSGVMIPLCMLSSVFLLCPCSFCPQPSGFYYLYPLEEVLNQSFQTLMFPM